MTELATSNTDQSAAQSKMKRISTKVRAAIDLMVSGKWKKIVDAAREVGRARESLSRALSKPHIAEHMRQPVMESLAWAAARAGAIKIELLDSPSEHVRDNASSFLLGLAGIKPETSPTISVNVNIGAGRVIDLSGDDEPKSRQRSMIDVTPAAIDQ
jgi:hypothetical protein